MFNKIILLFFVFLITIICKHPILYEISTRPWLYELSQKYGKSITKLKQIPLEEFDFLQEMGIDIIWMMGVWKLGTYGLEFDRKQNYSNVLPDWKEEDVIGSPYSIVEYICNPDIGTNDDLIWLRKEINSRNMKLMLDFVPNHSAIDAPTATSNPKLYIRAPNGVKDPKRYTDSGIAYGNAEWMDVIQWNYWEDETRNLMKNILMTVLNYADGARCDMAQLFINDIFGNKWSEELKAWNYQKPENEFWEYAFNEVKKKYPNAILLAEVYGDMETQKLFELGFTYTYDKTLLDKLINSANEVKDYIHYKNESFWGHSAHFVENHDENRIIANVEGNLEKAKAAGTIACTLGGMIFFNHGQWSGYKNKLDVHLRRGATEDINKNIFLFYKRLMEIIIEPAFKGDNYYFVYKMSGDKANDFIAYIREEDDSYFLIVVNYNQNDGCAEVPIYNLKGSGIVKLHEMINDVEYIRNANNIRDVGLNICLKGFQAQIFKYNY